MPGMCSCTVASFPPLLSHVLSNWISKLSVSTTKYQNGLWRVSLLSCLMGESEAPGTSSQICREEQRNHSRRSRWHLQQNSNPTVFPMTFRIPPMQHHKGWDGPFWSGRHHHWGSSFGWRGRPRFQRLKPTLGTKPPLLRNKYLLSQTCRISSCAMLKSLFSCTLSVPSCLGPVSETTSPDPFTAWDP